MQKLHQQTSKETSGDKLPWFEKWFIRDFISGNALIVLLFVGLGFLIYSNILDSPFVFDDESQILENYDVRLENISVESLTNAAFGRQSGHTRPVGNLSFALNYFFHQYRVAGYHLINIFIHIVTGILLWLIIQKTLNLKIVRPEIDHGRWIALIAALLWLANPVQTQSVTYIVQRFTSLAAMFFLLSFLLYLNGRLTAIKKMRRRWYAGAVMAWLLALGCKENAAILPFFIFLYEWYFFQDLSKEWIKRQWLFLAAILVVFGIIAFWYLGTDPWEKLKNLRDFSEGRFTMGQRLLTQTRVVMYYLSLVFLPHPSRLNLDYDFPLSHSLFEPLTTLLSLVAVLGLIILAVLLAKKQRLLSFCIIWFLGNLVIESSVIPLAIIFEHRVYLPSMLVWLIPVVILYRSIQPKWLVATVACALIVLYAYWTYERNTVWRDGLTLWADCVAKSPNKARPYTNLGVVQKKLNMSEDALENFRKALKLGPDYGDAHFNLGVILAERNMINEAIKHYRKAVELKPRHIKSRNNLGVELLKINRTDEAIDHFRVALEMEPRYASAHFNLGIALAKQGRLDEAIERYVYSIKSNPNDPHAHVKLGDALLVQGKPDQAYDHFQKALQLDPDNAEAHLLLGSQLLNLGRRDDALKHLNRAISINPELAQAHNNVGIIMIREGNLDAAISHFQKAVQIDPNFDLANINLKKALAIRNNTAQDATTIQRALKVNPNNPALHYKMGNLYLGKRKLGQAIAAFEKALALQPDFKAAQNNLALAYAADGQNEPALKAFEKLIALDPGNAGAYYNIAVLYALQNDVPEAIAWLKQAVDKGYQNWRLIKNDKDLANIRDSEEYKRLVEGR